MYVRKKDCFAYINDTKCDALKVIDCHECSFYQSKDDFQNKKIRYYRNLDSVSIRDINMAWFDEREKQVLNMRLGLNGKRKMTSEEVADFLELSVYTIKSIESLIVQRINYNIGE